MAQVLNLNNEVVKMRKEVKKVRVLTIRRLTRHIAKLKSKRGTEDAILKNHKRAQRLLEEIHAMKDIKFDQVTKLALGREINFEIVCKQPNSTASDRAVARLITHPLLKTKVADIKAAVQAFKDARQKPARTISSQKHKSVEELNKQLEVSQHSSSGTHSETFKQIENQDKTVVKEKLGIDVEKTDVCEKDKHVDSQKKNISDDFKMEATGNHELVNQKGREKAASTDFLSRAVDESVSDSDASQPEKNQTAKEYFDDSTEERFYNQSSGSDESDRNDDFFIGKVKRTKKKGPPSLPTKESVKSKELRKAKNSHSDMMQNANRESICPKTKAAKLESVFCNSLSNSKQKHKQVKRDHLSKNKLAFGKNNLHKQLPKNAGLKQDPNSTQLGQSLHPSWEASRRRREQVSQITAFQGKKIKFED